MFSNEIIMLHVLFSYRPKMVFWLEAYILKWRHSGSIAIFHRRCLIICRRAMLNQQLINSHYSLLTFLKCSLASRSDINWWALGDGKLYFNFITISVKLEYITLKVYVFCSWCIIENRPYKKYRRYVITCVVNSILETDYNKINNQQKKVPTFLPVIL